MARLSLLSLSVELICGRNLRNFFLLKSAILQENDDECRLWAILCCQVARFDIATGEAAGLQGPAGIQGPVTALAIGEHPMEAAFLPANSKHTTTYKCEKWQKRGLKINR
jgi:hypothetical protein